GCTFVCKPASQTPFRSLAAAALAARAGVPAGVLNVVTGDAAAIGGEMTSNTSVRKVTFTGSTAVGKKLMAQCAGTVKKLSLELGGNAPFIVFEDADLDAAVAGAIAASRSASSNTMNGALPPSSSDSFFTVPAHCAMSFLPTAVEPVKVTLRTLVLEVISPPIAAASPVTTLSTPAGTPARA